eukprot:scaffold14515_cov117-Isochrysis_galbana.AAC.2
MGRIPAKAAGIAPRRCALLGHCSKAPLRPCTSCRHRGRQDTHENRWPPAAGFVKVACRWVWPTAAWQQGRWVVHTI